MLYKLKAYFSKNRNLSKVYHWIFKRSAKNEPEIRNRLISKYSGGKSFIDVGCMWGVHGFFSFLAEELGAKSVVAFDIYDATDEFEKTKKSKNSLVQFVKGDINSKDCINKLGKFEVVYCTGLLYHVPDPLYTLSRLREICSDILILGTAVIPEMSGINNAAVYYPYLSESQRKIWNIHQGSQLGISEPFDPSQGYGNWIWGFSSSCLEAMIKSSGFSILEKHYGKFYSYIVCKLSQAPFLAVSGDWTNPDYSDNVSRYKY